MTNTTPGAELSAKPSRDAWKRAYTEVSNIPLSQLKGDLWATINARAIEIDRELPAGSGSGHSSAGDAP